MSIIAAALRELIAAGIEGDALVAAIARIEAATPRDEQADRRRAKDRERKKEKRLRNSADIVGDNGDERLRNSMDSAESADNGSLLNDPQPLLPNVEVNLNLSPKEKDTTCPKRKGPHRWPEGSFERIWAAYPNKVGKKAAFAKLAKIERDEEATPDEIIAGIERYKLDKPEHHEWKHPLTWLNGGCWLDEYAAPIATGPPMNGRPVQDFGARADRINEILEKRKAARDAVRH